MGINSALVDRARLVRMEAEGPRVEGSTRLGPVFGEWFRARLTIPAGQEGPDQPGGYRRGLSRPSLMFGMRDIAGDLVEVRFNDKVLVESVEQGVRTVWKVNGDPQPIRKKRAMIGWLAQLERVEEREFRELEI